MIKEINSIKKILKSVVKKKITPLHLNKKNRNAGIEPKKAGLNLIKKTDKKITDKIIITFKKVLNFFNGKFTNLLNKKSKNENIKNPIRT